MLNFTLISVLLSGGQAHSAEEWGNDTFYIGDLHAHSGASMDADSSDFAGDCETCGAIRDIVETALSNGLDFLAVSDHSNGNQVANEDYYLFVQNLVLEGHDPKGGLIVLPAAEVFFSLANGNNLGHKNLIMFGSDSELESLTIEDGQPNGTTNTLIDSCEDISLWMQKLESRLGPALIIPHHPALVHPMPTDWSCHDSEFSPAVEIYSRHGNSESVDALYDPPWLEIDPDGTVQSAIDPELWGHRLGFVGGTDAHDTQPGSVCAPEDEDPNRYRGGLTVSVIPNSVEYSRQALYSSIVDRRSYATSGPLIPAVVDYYSGGAYLGSMGDEAGIPLGQPLNVVVQTPEYHSQFVFEVVLKSIDQEIPMTLVDTGEWSATIEPGEIPELLYPVVKVLGGAWYSDQGIECHDGGRDNTERLWLSPTWFKPVPGDLDGDGVTWSDGDCDDGDPTRHPYAIESCTNGIDDDCDDQVDTLDSDCTPDSYALTVHHGVSLEESDISPWVVEIGNGPDLTENDTMGAAPERQEGGCASIPVKSSWLWLLSLIALSRRETAN